MLSRHGYRGVHFFVARCPERFHPTMFLALDWGLNQGEALEEVTTHLFRLVGGFFLLYPYFQTLCHRCFLQNDSEIKQSPLAPPLLFTNLIGLFL